MMKSKYSINIVLLLSFLLTMVMTGEAIAQKKTRTRLKVYYEKLSNNDKQISLELIQGSGKRMASVPKSEIRLTTYKLEDEVGLATIFTDNNGKGILIIEAGYKLPLDAEGYAIINAAYSGNDSLKAASKEIKFLDLNLDLSFKVIDSVNHIIVSAFALDSLGEKMPIAGIDLNIGVERLYSILYLAKIETEDDGIGTMEFPNDIPGDSVGILNLVVKVTEDKKYGTVTKASQIDWGTTVDFSNKNGERSLFGEQAPLWMIIAIFVILAGAWFHFILAILKVNKIRTTDQEEAFQ